MNHASFMGYIELNPLFDKNDDGSEYVKFIVKVNEYVPESKKVEVAHILCFAGARFVPSIRAGFPRDTKVVVQGRIKGTYVHGKDGRRKYYQSIYVTKIEYAESKVAAENGIEREGTEIIPEGME